LYVAGGTFTLYSGVIISGNTHTGSGNNGVYTATDSGGAGGATPAGGNGGTGNGGKGTGVEGGGTFSNPDGVQLTADGSIP
jgi:hypothetical protein